MGYSEKVAKIAVYHFQDISENKKDFIEKVFTCQKIEPEHIAEWARNAISSRKTDYANTTTSESIFNKLREKHHDDASKIVEIILDNISKRLSLMKKKTLHFNSTKALYFF